MGKKIRKELAMFDMNSIFYCKDPRYLKYFNWTDLKKELEFHVPTLWKFII